MSSEPDPDWLALPDCRLGGHQLPLVLLHPRYGILIQGGPPDAPALLRQRLERGRFSAIFPGILPIVRVAPGQSPERAFEGQPRLALPGGDAWMACARRALERPAPQGELAPILRRRRQRRSHRMAIAAGLLLLFAGGLVMTMAGMEPARSSLVIARPAR